MAKHRWGAWDEWRQARSYAVRNCLDCGEGEMYRIRTLCEVR